MIIGGLQKLTLIDYPSKIAATVFLTGCNFRCPFCHNPELVFSAGKNLGGGFLKEQEFFDFLKKRRGKLEGVCITGGEPSIQEGIEVFVKKIKRLGFLVKFDTNGSRPDILKKLINEKLVDYFAMDIKNSLKKYQKTTGVFRDTKRIKLSIDLIRNSGVDYEFRTTVVPGLHTKKDFLEIGKLLKGSRRYFLQKYEDKGKILDEKFRVKFGKKSVLNLEEIKNELKSKFDEVSIR